MYITPAALRAANATCGVTDSEQGCADVLVQAACGSSLSQVHKQVGARAAELPRAPNALPRLLSGQPPSVGRQSVLLALCRQVAAYL